MFIRILKIFCLCSYFAIENASADISIKLRHPIIYEYIYGELCSIDNIYERDCKMTLRGESLEFDCKKMDVFSKNMCNIPGLKGFLHLDNEANTTFHSLAELHKIGSNNLKGDWSSTKDAYERKIFKDFNNKNVKVINMNTNNYTWEDFFDTLSSKLTKVNQIIWYQHAVCHPVNKFLRKFKNLNKIEIHFEKAMHLMTCNDFYFTNLTHVKELRIGANPSDLYFCRNYSFLNESFLKGMENLEVFEFSFTITLCEVQIPKHLFQGLRNLSSIKFINCIITKLTEYHFRDLENLKSLTIIGGKIKDFEWLSSTKIQNQLMFLELDNDNAQIQESNLSAFICRDPNICEFNVGINKKPCPKGCQCSLNRLEMRFKTDCEQAEIGVGIPELPIPITGNASLYFSRKNLTQLPNSTLYGYSNIRELHLANNQLTSISVEQLPPNLTYFDLRNNSLQVLEPEVLEFLSKRAGKISMKLSGNPWMCNCDKHEMYKFLNNSPNIIEDRDHVLILCQKHYRGIWMPLLKADDCYPYGYIILRSLIGFVVLCIIYFYTKKSIFMWLYERNICVSWISSPEPKVDNKMKIDAFLAFSHVDLGLIEEYVEKLEKGPREYQLCFYQRDWQIGQSIPACILNSIEDSRRIIILMTNNFINSSWGPFEFRMAIKATSMNKDKRLIVILYPGVDIDQLDSELKIYMKYNTYLRRDDPLFWRKLMFAMPHKPIHCKQPALTDGRAIEMDQL